MITRPYTHPIYLEHLISADYPERPDRLRAIQRVLETSRPNILIASRYKKATNRRLLYVHHESCIEGILRMVLEGGHGAQRRRHCVELQKDCSLS